jgi:F-type H+-transporting ATPase subunit delta
MSLAVAQRYARALADVVLAPNSGLDPQAALEQLRAFAEMLASSRELANVLVSPAVAVGRKRAVIHRLGDQAGFHRLIRNFLFVAIDHRRIQQAAQLAAAFESAIDERLGRVPAEVVSAVALDASQQAAVRERLARLTGKEVRCQFRVDPALLGGLTARIGSTVYDGSVKGQLAALRQRLLPA